MLCILGSLSFCALGLLIASRARTIEAASGLMNFMMMPMWIASGVFFSAAKISRPVQPFIKALPLTALIDALRASMLQGADLPEWLRSWASWGLLADCLFYAGAETLPLAVEIACGCCQPASSDAGILLAIGNQTLASKAASYNSGAAFKMSTKPKAF